MPRKKKSKKASDPIARKIEEVTVDIDAAVAGMDTKAEKAAYLKGLAAAVKTRLAKVDKPEEDS